MKIAIGCDHGGFVLKEGIVKMLKSRGIEVEDFGCYDTQSVDYPYLALKVAEAVSQGVCDKGIVLCGTGIGISIAANKVKGIRAGVAHDMFTAEMISRHNNANIIAMGGRVISPKLAVEMTEKWLDTPFEGGRHTGRVDKITAIENKYFK